MSLEDYTEVVPDASIPDLLKQIPRWCAWQLVRPAGGKPTKVPDQSTRNLRRCRRWKQIEPLARVPASGVGFVFTNGVTVDAGHVLALDVDGCRAPLSGKIELWAIEIIEAFSNTYTEVTPSGTGIRLWLVVQNLPENLRSVKVRVPHPAPENVTKMPEVQIFGLGVAEYVTVTGWRLAACSDRVLVVENIEWLIETFDFMTSGSEVGALELPKGDGDPPTMEEIDRIVRSNPRDAQLARGDWEELFPGKSASEAFHALVLVVLRAARGHGHEAVQYLMSTPWGHGLIHNSKDPWRYTRVEWVEADVARAAAKQPTAIDPGSVFGELPTKDDQRQPETTSSTSRLIDSVTFANSTGGVQWLVKGLLPRQGLVQIYGEPSSGKTPFALSLALRVAGRVDSFFDHDVKQHGKVVYMVGEGRAGLARRLRAECTSLGLSLDDLQHELLWTACPGKLTDAADVKRWFEEIRATCGDLTVLVVDTQARNFGAGNENATQDMNLFVNNLAGLAEGLGCLIVLVHHTGHTNKDRGRGSSVLFGAIDACFEITRDGREVVATSTKEKDWEKPEPLRGMLIPVELGQDDDGDPVTAITLSDSPPSDAEVFADLVHDLAEDANLDAVWRAVCALDGAPTSLRALAESLGISKTEVGRKITLLVKRKLISRQKRGQNLVYPLTDKGVSCQVSQEGPGQSGTPGTADLFE